MSNIFDEMFSMFKNQYAEQIFDTIKDEQAKKLIKALIKHGCEPHAVLEAIMETSGDKNEQISQ